MRRRRRRRMRRRRRRRMMIENRPELGKRLVEVFEA
jgi:hypothetical protein